MKATFAIWKRQTALELRSGSGLPPLSAPARYQAVGVDDGPPVVGLVRQAQRLVQQPLGFTQFALHDAELRAERVRCGRIMASSPSSSSSSLGEREKAAGRSPEGSAREMDSTLPAVAEELLKEIRKAFQETSHVPDDLLLGLKFIFGPSAVPALDLVDQRSVTRVVSPSGRTAYQVLGSSGKLYTCYSSCHFCTCPAFGFTVLQKSESLLCKHILAVYLSQAMGACQELTVSEEQLTSILLAEEEDEG
uniref:Zinc finger SWIM-type containing 7 n=1 Tax=Gallus gallus TaxID=9031 RepID=A0A8V1ANJ2_CHICK